MANYPTPHINAKPGDFGKTVLMPGDPLRSKFIAETFLEKNPCFWIFFEEGSLFFHFSGG